MHRLLKKRFRPTQINKLGLVDLFCVLGIAMVGTIWAVYLESYLKNPAYVGFVTTLFTITGGLAYIFLIPIIQKRSKSALFATALFLYFVFYLLFANFKDIYVIIFLGACLAVVASLRISTVGIIVGDKSDKESLPKNEGFLYTIMNFSWLVGPLLAGFIAEKYGVTEVFIFAAGFMLIAVVLFKIFKIRDNRIEKKADEKFIQVVKKFFSKKERRIAYVMGGGICLWWAFIYTYIPIYIIENGFSDIILGYFLFAAVLPLILLEYRFGELATRKGFRKVFFWGYSIVATCAFACFFMPNLYFILGTIILASIGMAMLEPTTEAYFLELIKKHERDRYYGIYNTSIEVFYASATLISALVLLVLPFKFLFLLYTILMLTLALISLKTKRILKA